MAQQKATVQINKFVGGFVSDASPLTFPENTSAVDINMELNSDGSRQRALGIDYEDFYQTINTSIANANSVATSFNSYKWENVGGDPEKIIICIQFGNEVKFFDTDNQALSGGLVYTLNFPTADRAQRFSFTSVDGDLVIATGLSDIYTVSYDSGTFTYTTSNIKVRDFFGVEDIVDGTDLGAGSGIQLRPTTLTQPHLYNLRNQSFAIPRMCNNDEVLTDTAGNFSGVHNSIKGYLKWPSNADTVNDYLYADANDTGDRNSRRYFSADSVRNPLGSSRAAQGYFIIDLLNRGASRLSEDAKTRSNYPELVYSVTSLPTDRTPGGASVVGEFAGRVWFGGFSGEIIGGDANSPRLSSYIAFSQLVTNPSVITQCYQAGDPTSDNEPDIIDTDGGFIRLNNAYGVCGLVNLGKNMIVVAANGVWRIFGGNDSGFSATNYVVEKITDKGARGDRTVVQIENTLMFWSDDGIYWVKQNQYGDWIAENMTQNRIQKFFNLISIENKKDCVGVYDSYQRKVRWLYGNSLSSGSQQKELVYDINLNAFYERHISQITNGPIAVCGFNTNVFKAIGVIESVTVGGVNVTVGGVPISVTNEDRSSEDSLYEVGYVVVTQLSPTLKFTFAAYTDTTFTDWKSFNGVGVDAPAILVTGTADGGDSMKFKQIPYLYVHMKRTEDGFEGDFVPKHQSSCIIQSRWDWTNSNNSNKWGVPFEAYRYRRVYFPANLGDPYDTGYEMIVSKNKLRGRGRSIAIKFTSSPGKEMHIYGWSLVMTANGNV